MRKSPYLVEPSKKPQKAIKYAIKKRLFEKFNIEKKLIKDYLNGKISIPIWIVEAACNINSGDVFIPPTYQHIWFCLHKTKVKRTQPSGRIINPRIQFAPVYVKSNKKIKESLKKVSTFMKKKNFVELCGFKNHSLFSAWANNSIPITALIKACQITKNDFLDIIDNCKISASSSNKGSIIFNKERNADLETILSWIKAEGHLQIYSSGIETNQIYDFEENLTKLKNLLVNVFRMDKNSLQIYDVKSWNGKVLYISSASLRAILNLAYKIPLGYKTGCIVPDKELNLDDYSREEKLQILASFCESEGSFCNSITHKKFLSPRFEFKVHDKTLARECLDLLRSLYFINVYKNYNKKKREYQIGIYKFKEFLGLSFELFPYLSQQTRKKILGILATKDILARIYFKSSDISSLIADAMDLFEYKRDFMRNIRRINFLYYKNDYATEWVKGGMVPLSAIHSSCVILNRNIFEYVPTYTAIVLYAQKLIKLETLRELREK